MHIYIKVVYGAPPCWDKLPIEINNKVKYNFTNVSFPKIVTLKLSAMN